MKYIQMIICALLLAACSGEQGIERGEPAPDFTIYDVQGKPHRLSDYKGKVVMLYFWADFCPACEREFPETQKYYSELKGDDFELLAINVGQAKKISQTFGSRFGATFPMLVDTASQVSKQYGVEQLPTNYFISPDGKVARRITGWVDANQVRVMINQHKEKH